MRNITKEIKLRAHYRQHDVFNCWIMTYQGYWYFIPSGLEDTIYGFHNGIGIYTLTIGAHRSYVSLNSYMSQEPDPINTVFLHGEQDIENAFGADWVEMDPEELATALLSRLY